MNEEKETIVNLEDCAVTMTKEDLWKHIRENVSNEYSAMVVVAALYKRIYGEFPKIGMSGQQAEFAEELSKELP